MRSRTLQSSICLLSSLLLLVGMSISADAQNRYRYQDGRFQGGRFQGRVERLGIARVDGRRDHDLIRVYARGGFRGIQLRVQGGVIGFERVVVHFENGNDVQVDVRDRINPGGQTRVIDLPGDNRRIRSVEVWYGRENWGRRRPTLTLYGIR
jgi:hypothetical protein